MGDVGCPGYETRGNPDTAVDYAYRYLRQHFGAAEAHQAFAMSMLPGPFSPSFPPTLEMVANNAAVCYQELPLVEPKWVVLENTSYPNGDFEEISLESPRAKVLIGKHVGDVVVIGPGRFQDRTAKIVQIIPKYVRRFQDSIAEQGGMTGALSSSPYLGPDDSESSRQ